MPDVGGSRRTMSTRGPQIAKLRAMPKTRSKTKPEIEQGTSKVRAAAERTGEKVKQAGRSMKEAGRRAKNKTKSRVQRER
jgi:hypothetical protein